MIERLLCLFLILFMLLLSNQRALAKWGTTTVTDDNGEQVVVKHGLFGKKTIVKDRFGDGVANSKSIFGLTKDTQVNVLGNDVRVHKGLFGFSKTEGHDILGDSVSSKKNLLYHNTNVNLSGVNNLLNKYLGPKNLNSPAMDPGAINRGPMDQGLMYQGPMNRGPMNPGTMNPGTMNQEPIESTPRFNPLPETNPSTPLQTQPSTQN
jgi:hypothetical protein